ncbi:hypothetical protein [Brevibacterium senegalense]|uniref:hypothetical protein n=1 Tax=Brevibacterium senegalense TaxID=1033736 RepID=UPI0002F462CF|nr:hypothetical protein [Brevibacterium senegalense]
MNSRKPLTPATLRSAPWAVLVARLEVLTLRLTHTPPRADYATTAAEYRAIRAEFDRRSDPASIRAAADLEPL